MTKMKTKTPTIEDKIIKDCIPLINDFSKSYFPNSKRIKEQEWKELMIALDYSLRLVLIKYKEVVKEALVKANEYNYFISDTAYRSLLEKLGLSDEERAK